MTEGEGDVGMTLVLFQAPRTANICDRELENAGDGGGWLVQFCTCEVEAGCELSKWGH